MKTLTLEQALAALIDYRGKTPKKTNLGIPLVTAKIVKNGFILEPNEFIAEADYDTWMRRGIPKVGDVVLTTEAPLGEVAMIKNPSIALAQRIVTLRGKEGVLNNYYLKYFFMSPIGREKLRERSSGTTVLGIKQSELRKIELVLPSFPVQEKIAEVLSVYDNLIENNNRRIKILEEIAKKIYTEWFVYFRFPGHKKAKIGKDGLPEGWKLQKLRDHIELSRGVSYSGGNLSTDNSDLPLLSLKSFLRRGGYRNDGIKYFSGQLKESQTATRGDLLIANTDLTQEGDIIGAPLMVPNKYPKVAFTHHVYALHIKKESRLTMIYLYYHMLLDSYRGYVRGHGNGTTVLGLSRESIYDYAIVCPDMKTTDRFSEHASSLRSEIETLVEMNLALIAQRDQLIPQLLTGKLEVKV